MANSSKDSKANQIDTGNSSKQDANTNQKEATTTEGAWIFQAGCWWWTSVAGTSDQWVIN